MKELQKDNGQDALREAHEVVVELASFLNAVSIQSTGATRDSLVFLATRLERLSTESHEIAMDENNWLKLAN